MGTDVQRDELVAAYFEYFRSGFDASLLGLADVS
jgi:hypothetical protein